MSRVRIFQVDAFTTQAFAGNPAGVVLDAQCLNDAEMQQIARELNNGDTIFLLPADAPDHDLRARFFTPRAESAFVGHASIAAHAVLATLGLPPARRQKQCSGIVEFERQTDARGQRYAFTQPPPPVQRVFDGETLQATLVALGLQPGELDLRCPAVVAGASGSRALIAVRDGTALARLRPNMPQLAALSAAGAPAGYFIYTLTPAVPGCLTEARMFCPVIGIPEDPVSGNAHAMLAAHLYRLGLLATDNTGAQFVARQGHHIGRPGLLSIEVRVTGDQVSSVQVAGSAVIVFAAAIELPKVA